MTIPIKEEFERTRRSRQGEQKKEQKKEAPYAELKKGVGKVVSFRKGDKIGQGSFGIVFKAMDNKTGQVIAVKQIDVSKMREDQLKAIETEVTLMETLQHDHVVQLLGSHRLEKHLLIMMEYVEGQSLHERIKEFAPLQENVVRTYVTQILKGLAYCHERKIIHRDIKSKNILVAENGRCLKLADFGSAKLVDDILKDQGLSVNYHYTPLWLAPEVVSGKYTSKVDIWSLGCTMLEMASGRDPWSEEQFENSFQALYFIANTPKYPKFPTGLSPLAIDFLKACFNRDEKARPTAVELLQHDFIVKGAQVSGPQPPLSPTSPTSSSSLPSPFGTGSTSFGLRQTETGSTGSDGSRRSGSSVVVRSASAISTDTGGSTTESDSDSSVGSGSLDAS